MKRSAITTIALAFLAIFPVFSQGSWREYRDEVKTGLIRGGNIMNYFTEAKDGSIWVSNTTGSIVRLKDDNVTIFDDLKRSLASQTNIGLIVEASERQIHVYWKSVADMETGWVWLVSNRGIALWDGNLIMHATNKTDDQSRMIFYAESSEKNYIIEDNKTVELPESSIKVRDPLINMYSVLIDGKGVTWFGGFKGSLYSIEDGVWTAHHQIENYHRAGITDKDKSILKIAEDHLGNLWLISAGIVTKFSNGEFICEDTLPPLKGANDMTERDDGSIWIGTSLGVYSYNGHEWTLYGEDAGIDDIQYAGSIETDSEGNIWFLATTNVMFNKPGYVYKYNGQNWEKNHIGKKSILTDMIVDSKGRVWVCELRGIYVMEDGEWKLMRDCPFSRSFNKVFEDSKGRIWIGRGSFTGEIDLYTE